MASQGNEERAFDRKTRFLSPRRHRASYVTQHRRSYWARGLRFHPPRSTGRLHRPELYFLSLILSFNQAEIYFLSRTSRSGLKSSTVTFIPSSSSLRSSAGVLSCRSASSARKSLSSIET